MIKLSFKIIGMNKTLLVFPIMSGATIILVLSTFVLGFWFVPVLAEVPPLLFGITAFLIYIILFFISYFFQAALVASAYETMEGGKPTIRWAIKKASKRAGTIFTWAVISAFIGLIFRIIERKFPIASLILGFAWSIATYFVVPVIVFEDKTAWQSLKRSGAVLKESWGETVFSYMATGFIFLFIGFFGCWVLIAIAINFQDSQLFVVFLLAALIYAISILLLSVTVSTVLRTALYRYVKTGQIDITMPPWFHPFVIGHAPDPTTHHYGTEQPPPPLY